MGETTWAKHLGANSTSRETSLCKPHRSRNDCKPIFPMLVYVQKVSQMRKFYIKNYSMSIGWYWNKVCHCILRLVRWLIYQDPFKYWTSLTFYTLFVYSDKSKYLQITFLWKLRKVNDCNLPGADCLCVWASVYTIWL